MPGFGIMTVVCITGAFAFGMVLALLGSIKLPLAKLLDMDETRVGGLLSALNLALIPMMLLSGLLIDAWGVGRVMILGSLLTAAAIAGLAVVRTYALALLSILVVGLGGACVSASSVVMMPQAFWPDKAAASLNLGNVFFGLGALVTPALADVLMRSLDFRRALAALAAICAVPAVLAAVALSQFAPVGPQHTSLTEVLSLPAVWLCGLVFLLYGPLEWSVATWATTYLTDHGYQERRAALVLSGFWLMFLAARLLAAFLQERGILTDAANPWVIVVMALLAGVALGNLAGASTRGNAGLGLLLLGAAFGPIFPTLVGILFEQSPERHHGTAYGAMFALGSLGSLVLPPLIGRVARRKTVQHALRIPMVVCLVLAAATLVLGLVIHRI